MYTHAQKGLLKAASIGGVALFAVIIFGLASQVFAADQRSWVMDPEGIRDFVNSKGFNIPADNLGAAMNFDSTTAKKVCELAGFRTVVSMDTKYPEKYSASGYRDGWYSPHDNQLANWTGSYFRVVNAAAGGNRWISSLTCGDKIVAPTPTPTATPTATPTPAGRCNDGIDNDNNGYADTADSSCHTDGNPKNPNSYDPNKNGETGANAGSTCADSRDNNSNGLIDGGDPICHTDGNANNPSSYDPSRSEVTVSNPTCSDGVDNDNNGYADAADSSCHTDHNPKNPNTYNPNGNEGSGNDSGTCADSRDNNSNGLIDGGDPICHTDGNANNPSSFDGDRNETGTTPTPTPTPTATPTPSPTATPCVTNCGGTTTIITENKIVVVTEDGDDDKDTIELYVTDDRETIKQGETLTYRIVIKNNKDHDLENVKIINRLPIYLTPFATNPSASADSKSRTITWDNQTISANSEVTFSLKVRVDQSAPNGFLLQNVAIINGDGIRANASDSTLIQGAVPQIAGASTTGNIQAVPVSAKTGIPFDSISMLFSFSGTVATAGTLIAKRFI